MHQVGEERVREGGTPRSKPNKSEGVGRDSKRNEGENGSTVQQSKHEAAGVVLLYLSVGRYRHALATTHSVLAFPGASDRSSRGRKVLSILDMGNVVTVIWK